MDTIPGATIVIGGDSRDLERTIDRVSESMKDLGRIAENAFAAFGVGFGVSEILKLAGVSATLATELSKLSGETGATVLGLQAVRHAAEQGGVPLDALSATIRAVAASLNELQGGGGIAETFQKLGIAASDLKGLDIDAAFALIAEAVKNTTISTKDLGETLKAIGFDQEAMIRLLERGGKTFSEARAEVIGYGAALSDIDAAEIRNATKQWEDFKLSASNAISAVGNKITAEFAPLVSGLLKELEGLGSVDLLNRPLGIAVYGLIGAFGVLADGVEKVRRAIDATGRIADGLFGKPPSPTELDALFPSERLSAWVKANREAAQAMATTTIVEDAAMKARIDSRKKSTDAIVAEEDKKLIAEQAAAATHLQTLLKQLLTTEDFETASYARRLEQLVGFREQGLLTEQSYNDLVERNNQVHVDKINEAQAKSFTESQRLYVGYAGQVDILLGSITSAIGSQGKKQFALSKAIALASALVKGYEAIVSSYAAGSAIGGPPVGAAFAAIAAASTAAQIAALRSTNENSSGGGGGGGGGSADAGAGAVGPSQTLRVEGLDPSSLLSGDVVKQFANQLLQFQADGGKVIL